MLTLPAATPFTVMVIPLTDTVAFVLSADTARKLLSVAPSGWKATVSVVLCPFTTEELAKDDVVNIDIDLLGLKNYVKITASGAAATNTTLAVVLGDKHVQPV